MIISFNFKEDQGYFHIGMYSSQKSQRYLWLKILKFGKTEIHSVNPNLKYILLFNDNLIFKKKGLKGW